ncbi:HEPN domain-containing protein [Patulibacter defluvii]|uniref:HEPN domain-containing protein n=1 Tax=Patulibacter defluvii TaxID=3095358 RepID=UPI002A761A6A|nr:HEPN domain-containing protein [Patulibacter sp. DM4]
MASSALRAFQRALGEIQDLERADPTPSGGTPADSRVARAVGRASVVLLTSHFERYVYAANEEASRALVAALDGAERIPESMKLLHSRPAIEEMIETGWEKRGAKLHDFMASDGWLWSGGGTIVLEHDRLLRWMKTPSPKNLVRYYKYWGVDDVFRAVTRTAHTRTELWLRIDEMVTKRNNIAHGDASTEATPADLRSYKAAARRFCARADRQLARAVSRIGGSARPW